MLLRGCKSWQDMANINMYLQDSVPTGIIKYRTNNTYGITTFPHYLFEEFLLSLQKWTSSFPTVKKKRFHGEGAVKNYRYYSQPLKCLWYHIITNFFHTKTVQKQCQKQCSVSGPDPYLIIWPQDPYFWITSPVPDPYYFTKVKKTFQKKVQYFKKLMLYPYRY